MVKIYCDSCERHIADEQVGELFHVEKNMNVGGEYANVTADLDAVMENKYNVDDSKPVLLCPLCWADYITTWAKKWAEKKGYHKEKEQHYGLDNTSK